VGLVGTEVGEKFIAHVTRRLLNRLDGLSDEEYLWEPTTGAWSIRPGNDGTWHPDLGPTGSTATPLSPAPFTTIAWRLWHLGASPNPTWPPHAPPNARDLLEGWVDQRPPSSAEAVRDAATACRLLGDHWLGFAKAVSAMPDGDLLSVMGPVAGPWAASTFLGLVLHIGDELVHHSAEVGVLRDLYQHQSMRGG
jgi:hypothetical protein